MSAPGPWGDPEGPRAPMLLPDPPPLRRAGDGKGNSHPALGVLCSCSLPPPEEAVQSLIPLGVRRGSGLARRGGRRRGGAGLLRDAGCGHLHVYESLPFRPGLCARRGVTSHCKLGICAPGVTAQAATRASRIAGGDAEPWPGGVPFPGPWRPLCSDGQDAWPLWISSPLV